MDPRYLKNLSYKREPKPNFSYYQRENSRPKLSSFGISPLSHKKEAIARRSYSQKEEQSVKLAQQISDATNQKMKATLSISNANFESTKVESIIFLQKIEQKLNDIFVGINQRIETFSNHIKHKLNLQFQNLKQRIHIVVDTMFEETHDIIQHYIQFQQNKYASDLIQIKEDIAKERKISRLGKIKLEEKIGGQEQDWLSRISKICRRKPIFFHKEVLRLIYKNGNLKRKKIIKFGNQKWP